MTVRLTQAVLGQAVGSSYTGALEAWLLNEGYATTASSVPDAWGLDSDDILGAENLSVTVTPTAAILTAGSNAASTVGTNGSIILGTKGGVRTTVALLSGDTASQAAGKIDTAMTGMADAAIVSSKLKITSTETGLSAYVVVLGGTSAVLTALGVTVGQSAHGGDGLPAGASNVGVQATTPAHDPQLADNREAPYFPSTPDRDSTIANDGDNLTDTVHRAPGFDFDDGGVDDDAPSNLTMDVTSGPEEGGTVIHILGNNLEGVTAVKFGGSGGVVAELDDSAAGDGVLVVTTPARAAGAGTVDIFLDHGSNDVTMSAAFTYTATMPTDLALDIDEGSEDGGDVVTITGSNLAGVTAVKFGGSSGTAGTSLDVSDAADGTILVTTPAHAPGTVDVFLENGTADATMEDAFTFVAEV